MIVGIVVNDGCVLVDVNNCVDEIIDEVSAGVFELFESGTPHAHNIMANIMIRKILGALHINQ